MKRITLVCFLIIGLYACNSKGKPDNLLSQDKMVEVLVDIHLTEGITSALPIAYDSSQVLYKLLEYDVFLKHEVEDSVFSESLRYYMADPTIMDKIYLRVVDSLTVIDSSSKSEEIM